MSYLTPYIFSASASSSLISCFVPPVGQLRVHAVDVGFGIVELDWSALGATVVSPKGGVGILQSLAKKIDFCCLLVSLFFQHRIRGGVRALLDGMKKE